MGELLTIANVVMPFLFVRLATVAIKHLTLPAFLPLCREMWSWPRGKLVMRCTSLGKE
jgi:hypothetical protein